VDTSLFAAAGDAAPLAGEPCLLQVASLAPVKGQRLLLEAFATVSRSLPCAHLHLVGDGPERGTLERSIRELSLVGRVTLHGPVPHHLLPPYYRAADLHIVSSRFESQGMTTLEAAACGTATVGTAVGILPEMGLPTVPTSDPAGLAAAVLGVLESPNGARRLGEMARTWVHDELTLDRCVARLVGLYSSPMAELPGADAAGLSRTT
jgi:glycosyltransferase involved in cell wall biosynthesis